MPHRASMLRACLAVLAISSLSTVALAQDEPVQAVPPSAVVAPDALSQAQAAAQRGDAAEALSRYLRVLSSRPDDPAALAGAGRAALDVGDVNAAAGFFARADARDPRNGQVKAGLARVLLQRGDARGALRYFREATGLGLPLAAIAADRGLAQDLRGDPRRAQADYLLALAAHPDAETSRRLALSQAIAGDRAAAMATLDPLLRRQDVPAWRTRALVLALTGDPADALTAAALVMRRDQVDALAPYLPRLASLKAPDKAAAVHLGRFPDDAVSPVRTAGIALPPPIARSAAATAPQPPAKAAAAERPSSAQTVALTTALAPAKTAANTPPSPPIGTSASSPVQTTAAIEPSPSLQTAAIAPAPLRASAPPASSGSSVGENQARPPRSGGTESPAGDARLALADTQAARRVSGASPGLPAPVTPPPSEAAGVEAISVPSLVTAPASRDALAAPARPPSASQPAIAPPRIPTQVAPAAAATASPPALSPTSRTAATTKAVADTKPAPSRAEKLAEEKARKAEAAAKKKAEAERLAEAEERKAKAREPARHWVQVAGGANRATLGRAWSDLKDRWPKQLAGRSPWTTHYRFTNRLLIGPFPTSDAAQDWVSDRKAEGLASFRVETNAGDPVERVKP